MLARNIHHGIQSVFQHFFSVVIVNVRSCTDMDPPRVGQIEILV
jgi:hypothetical protein